MMKDLEIQYFNIFRLVIKECGSYSFFEEAIMIYPNMKSGQHNKLGIC